MTSEKLVKTWRGKQTNYKPTSVKAKFSWRLAAGIIISNAEKNSLKNLLVTTQVNKTTTYLWIFFSRYCINEAAFTFGETVRDWKLYRIKDHLSQYSKI